MIDEGQIPFLKGHGKYPGSDFDDVVTEWPEDATYSLDLDDQGFMQNINWGSGSFNSKGLLTFYIDWLAVNREEADDDFFYEKDDDDYDDYDY